MLQFLRARQASFAGGSLVTVVFNGAALLAQGVAAVLVARALGPEQWGYVVWFTAGTAVAALFADLLGIYYSSAYLLARGDPPVSMATIRGTVMAYGALAGALGGLLVGAVPWVRAVAFPGFHGSLWGWLVAANTAGLVMVSQARGVFWGQRSFLLVGALNLGKSAGFAALALAVVYGLGDHRAIQVAGAQLMANWLCVLGSIAFLAWRGLGLPNWSYLRSCVRVGRRAVAINWVSFLNQRADQYLVNALLGPAAVGLYGIAVSLGELVTQVPGFMGMVLFPLTAGDRDQGGAARSTLRRTLAVMAIVAAFMLPLGVFAPQVVTFFFGSQFQESATLLRHFLPAIVFLSGLLMLNQHIAGMGYPIFQFWAMLSALAFNVGLNLTFLPRLGVLGAPLAASLSYGVWLLLVGGYLVRKGRERKGKRG
jgi:O-antigen/teichoic acid export membrane protein